MRLPSSSKRLLALLSLLPLATAVLLRLHMPSPGEAQVLSKDSTGTWTCQLVPSPSLFRTMELLVTTQSTVLSCHSPTRGARIEATPEITRIWHTLSPRTKDTLLITLRDHGNTRPRVNSRFLDPSLGIGYGLMLILSLLPFLWCLAGLLFSTENALIPTFAAFLHMTAAALFPWDVRGWDVQGHISYLRLLDLHGKLPLPDECWQCYQPPFYYLVNVLPFRLGRILFKNPELILAPFTCILGITSLWLGLAALKQIVPQSRLQPIQLIYATFITFILMAGKPNNDVFVLLFSTLALNMCWRWCYNPTLPKIASLSLFCGLALLAKTSGVVICVCIGATIILRGILPNKLPIRNVFKYLATFLSILVPIAVAALWISIGRASNSISGNSEYIVGNIAKLGTERLSNDLQYFLYPNLSHWFRSTGLNISEHVYFWNAMMKSCFFGDYLLLDPWNLLGYPLMASSSVLLVTWSFSWLRATKKDLMWAIPLIISIIAVATFRWKYPYVCSADFRYVSFAALPACAGLTLIPGRILRYLGLAIAGSQIAYILGLYLQP